MFIDHAAPRAVGLLGSALIALGGLGAGALPVGIRLPGADHAQLGLVGVYSGLALLLLGWWWYGRVTRHAPDETCRTAWRTLALWTAPLLVAPPMFSRDVYSYLAQGLMIHSGMDVYRHGPAVLGGMIAEQVPAIWQHTPSPYGPVFLMVADAVARPLGSHLILGVIAMRLVAVAGLALLAYSIRLLARSAGVSPSAATWLAVLNPLTLIHLVGGAHNDALMVGLLAAGLAAAVRHRPIVATLLVVAAALVKVPAALGLCAVALIWAAQLRGRWPQVRAGSAVIATAAGATVLITAAAGTGYGWIGALSTPISPQNWSLTSALGRWTAAALAQDSVGATVAQGVWRWAGMLATLIVAGLVWTYRQRLGPVYGLGIVLVAVVAFGPAIRAWYLVWGLVPLAAVASDLRVRRALAGVCAVLVLITLPDGFAPDAERVLLAVLGALIGIATFLAVRLAVAPATLRLARMSR
ncbi:polyprenol phosphomannose-dependent alpha 1,6 mannosyltransferase MptB [Actinoplanes sp. TBRC 11911]|uniref:polyprenol phosphomannose-dependent alpha 1,6 mannosyltransferase MptB n=1 Tax=Actinoplanes sp. TBRC 11911 TaxID=2729386 RepID=UPI00145EB9AE|nr:polyprenol phosphomannose-dependent alpha 1,6 mannosyltransferase MptB [Actinoplanes sp. TBRC 11911]NMO50901.1 polyprenol phosphomannose-dependent alpha 1,6 mannosyltransferase MptB [Actinoplanes sp. TBRC 11911]